MEVYPCPCVYAASYFFSQAQLAIVIPANDIDVTVSCQSDCMRLAHSNVLNVLAPIQFNVVRDMI